ncbi:hypothetical protein [Bradyrhizobium sp. LA2.1]|uniref:hypothetical protein n=1 Tax=Bradyrhizobium sp. LA2.1 TaxID=3156376 RepID=UPI003395763E
MITIDDLKKNAKFRGLMFLDMAHGAYENHYQSETYPRLVVIKAGAPRSPKVKQIHTTTYFVDSMECPDLDAVINLLNATPHPKRTDLARHQDESSPPPSSHHSAPQGK